MVRVRDSRVVAEREDEGEYEVHHVEDGEGGEIVVGGTAHASSRHDHDSYDVSDDAHCHYGGYQDSLDQKSGVQEEVSVVQV